MNSKENSKEEFFAFYGKYENLLLPNKKFGKDCFNYVVSFVYSLSDYAYLFSGIDMNKVTEAVEKRKPSLLEKGNLSIFAKSAYLYYRLKNENVSLISTFEECKNYENFEGKGIGIVVVYKDWIFIKKLSEKAKPYEVSAMLSAAVERFLEKYYIYQYGTLKKDYKKVSNLEDFITMLKNAESLKERLEIAFSSKIKPFPFFEGLLKAYPELKIRKR